MKVIKDDYGKEYEVSNFAQPAMNCRHNEAYWDCRAWEAFGPGAARFDGRNRTTNLRSVSVWIKKLLNHQSVTGDVDTMTAEGAEGRIPRYNPAADTCTSYTK